jgi:anti-anti-sigma factor
MIVKRAVSGDGKQFILTPDCRRLDAGAAEDFKAGFAAALSEAKQLPDQVILDLGGVGSVDSAGLGALIAGLKRTRRLGVELRLRSVCAEVRELLEITLVSRIFTIEDLN